MPLNKLAIGLLLGLTSAVVFASAATGPLLVRFLLFLITPLPIFLAGLGWGPASALIAGAAGALLVLFFGPKAALIYAASQALPAAALTYLAMLSRPVEAAPGQPESREWYPVGRLVVWSAVLAGIPALLWVLFFGADLETLRTTLGKPLADYLKEALPAGPDGTPLGEEDVARITDIILGLLPAGSAISWMAALLFNLWLAGRIMVASGQLIRPWPDLAAMEFPAGTPLALAAATALSFVDGWVGTGASGFSGTFLLAYVLMGLAVIHYVSRGTAWRPFLLWALYGSLLFVNAPLALPLALLGLIETFLRLRARAGSPRSGKSS